MVIADHNKEAIEKARETAARWAKYTPQERCKLYRDLCLTLRELADTLHSQGHEGEHRRLHLTARNMASCVGAVRIPMDNDQPCCVVQAAFGECEC